MSHALAFARARWAGREASLCSSRTRDSKGISPVEMTTKSFLARMSASVEAEREGSVLSALSVRVRGVEVEVEFSSQPG